MPLLSRWDELQFFWCPDRLVIAGGVAGGHLDDLLQRLARVLPADLRRNQDLDREGLARLDGDAHRLEPDPHRRLLSLLRGVRASRGWRGLQGDRRSHLRRLVTAYGDLQRLAPPPRAVPTPQ